MHQLFTFNNLDMMINKTFSLNFRGKQSGNRKMPLEFSLLLSQYMLSLTLFI